MHYIQGQMRPNLQNYYICFANFPKKIIFYDDTFRGNEKTFLSVDMIYHTQQYAISNSRLMQQLGKCENKIFKCVFRQKMKEENKRVKVFLILCHSYLKSDLNT